MTNGALLSLTGERKVSIASRDVKGLQFKLDRVLSNQLQHFVSQTYGEFEKGRFESTSFGPENISEVFTEVKTLAAVKKGTTQYSAMDFSQYIKGGKHGLFIFTARGWDPKKKRTDGPSDQRVVLVTDMGLLVKENHDQSLTVFVQSIHDGRPMPGTKVDVIGKNGLAVHSGMTTELGTLQIPKVSSFKNEKQAVAIVATRGDDVSFIPLRRSSRMLNFSRFDVGGAYLSDEPRRLEAFVFSDRGIYRPGDEFHISTIVKSPDWSATAEGAPLEFAVSDARGYEIFKQKFQVNKDGFHEFSYQTEDSSPTGTYEVGVYLIKDNLRSALIGSTTIRVEEFLPDRLRIATRLSEEASAGWVKQTDLTGFVTLHNLFGTPAQDRKVKASFSLSPAGPVFKGLSDYQFVDPNKTKTVVSEALSPKQTDKDGQADFSIPLAKFDKGMYRLTFAAEGFEAEGGRGVYSQSRTLVSARDELVGVKPDGRLDYIRQDEPRSMHIIVVDHTLKKIPTDQLSTSLVEYKFVSVLMRQSSGLFKYESLQKEVALESKPLSIPADGLNFTLPTARIGRFAVVIRDKAGLELNRMPFNVIGKGDLSRSLEKNSELQIALARSDYSAGEEIEMQITAPFTGAGVITIEREKVYAVKWFKSDATSSIQRITLPPGIEGNAYVNVSFIRAQDSKDVFMSPLSYGVVPFTVSRESRTNKIDLSSPEVVQPGQKLSVKYKTSKPAKIVIYGVDEGILQVAKYKTPQPLDFFLRKRALQVQTFQILDLIMPEFSILKSASAPGGGEGGLLGANLNPFKRKSLKPVVFWSSILDADASTREFQYEVPDYFNGSIKVMAVAVSNATVGVAESKTTVRGPFVISPNAPTFAAPGDEFVISAGIANNRDGAGEDDLSVKVELSKNLQAKEGLAQTLKLAKGREGSVRLKVKALDQLGDATIVFHVKAGEQMAKMRTSLSIRPPTTYQTSTISGLSPGGETSVDIPRSVYGEFSKQTAAISSFPIALAKGLTDYLDNFPHLCTEQILSKAVPAAFLSPYKNDGFDLPKDQQLVENAIRVLRMRQNGEGAFGFWAANSYINSYQTIYAAHVLTDFAELGYAVPQDIIKNALSYLQKFVTMPDNSLADARDKAYAIYVLQRNGLTMTAAVPELAATLNKKYEKSWKNEITGAFVASIYQMMQAKTEASSLIANVDFGKTTPADGHHFYDLVRRDGQILYLLSKHFPDRAKALSPVALNTMVQEISQGHFTTQSAAQAIMGFHAFAQLIGEAKTLGITAQQVAGDQAKKPLSLVGSRVLTGDYALGTKAVTFLTPNDAPLFYQVVQSGFDRSPATKAVGEKLEVQREYQDDKGGVITKAKVGDTIRVHVKIRSLGPSVASNLAIIDLLPGGFEVDLTKPVASDDAAAAASEVAPAPDPGEETAAGGDREGETSDAGEGEDGSDSSHSSFDARVVNPVLSKLVSGNFAAEHADIREDRVVVYGSARKEVTEFTYRVRLTTQGEFLTPPIFAESLYDRTIRANSTPSTFTVVE